MSNGTQNEFAALLDFLKRNRGFDFSGYKQASLMRRIQKRMQVVDIDRYLDYIDHLEVHQEEFTHLFNTILINVTGFFRDPTHWDFLATEIIPKILENKSDGEGIRIWSTGCSSGEEAFSIAILFAELLGEDAFRERIKIYATDIDEEALNLARLASFTEKQMDGIPEVLLEKYFTHNGRSYSFDKELRRNIIFGRNDLIQDAPISRIDLLICRNTLMYFNAETQAKILARFHFALNDDGYLFLGKAETLLTHSSMFIPIDLKLRIFGKVPKVNVRERLLISGNGENLEGTSAISNLVRLREEAFDTSPVAQVVVDINYKLILANDMARSTFGIRAMDFGRPFQDLELSYRPYELRSLIQKAYSERLPFIVKEVEFSARSESPRYFDIRIQPLIDDGIGILGVNISFEDVTLHKHLQAQLEQTNHELETAFEELQSTNEELETTNEELQSTIEELETTNEELQSSNEELETMNEELQSTNEELQTINDELRQRTGDLNQVNAFLEAILTSLRAAVTVIDKDMRILVWNRLAEDMWGLRADEVHMRNFLSLDIGLPVERLKKSILTCLSGESVFENLSLSAHNRRGKEIICKVECSPLISKDSQVKGVIVLMEEKLAV